MKRVRGLHGITEELTIELPAFHVRNDGDLVIAALDALRWNADAARQTTPIDGGDTRSDLLGANGGHSAVRD